MKNGKTLNWVNISLCFFNYSDFKNLQNCGIIFNLLQNCIILKSLV
jgi:hypothetical protein